MKDNAVNVEEAQREIDEILQAAHFSSKMNEVTKPLTEVLHSLKAHEVEVISQLKKKIESQVDFLAQNTPDYTSENTANTSEILPRICTMLVHQDQLDYWTEKGYSILLENRLFYKQNLLELDEYLAPIYEENGKYYKLERDLTAIKGREQKLLHAAFINQAKNPAFPKENLAFAIFNPWARRAVVFKEIDLQAGTPIKPKSSLDDVLLEDYLLLWNVEEKGDLECEERKAPDGERLIYTLEMPSNFKGLLDFPKSVQAVSKNMQDDFQLESLEKIYPEEITQFTFAETSAFYNNMDSFAFASPCFQATNLPLLTASDIQELLGKLRYDFKDYQISIDYVREGESVVLNKDLKYNFVVNKENLFYQNRRSMPEILLSFSGGDFWLDYAYLIISYLEYAYPCYQWKVVKDA